VFSNGGEWERLTTGGGDLVGASSLCNKRPFVAWFADLRKDYETVTRIAQIREVWR
jgi:hypothetical protein